jgi:recombination protein RecA
MNDNNRNNSLQELMDKDEERLLKQKLKALGIDEKCLKPGDIENIDFIPTGVFEVDSILGAGMGIPTGTLVEFCGESQSGKTWLGYKLIAEAQKQGKKCAFFNIENSYYPQRALSCGVNTSQLLMVENVGSAEKYGELLKYMVETGDYAVIVVDSISAMIPSDELEKTLEQVQTIGLHARFVKRLTKDLTAKTASTGTIVVLINQLYMGAGAMPGSMVKTASGGNAMNYFTHMRLWINKINGAAGQVTKKDSEGKDVVIGGKSKVLVMKTRYGQPGLTGEFKIMFTDDNDTNLLDEFLYRAKAKGFEYIKESRKKYIYLNSDTGEQLESKDPYEFVGMLMNHPAPVKKTRGDNSNTAFEYIAGRLKYSGKPLNDLLEFIKKGPSDVESDDEESDDESGISFEDAKKLMDL